jgi:hypothetical protein
LNPSGNLPEVLCYKDSELYLDSFQCRAQPEGAVRADGSLASSWTLECINENVKTS